MLVGQKPRPSLVDPFKLRSAVELVRSFADMITHLHGERLAAWTAAAEQAALPGITRFATGLTADLAAVTAGLSLPFSSGPVEGNVNRIKDDQAADVRPSRFRPAPQADPADPMTEVQPISRRRTMDKDAGRPRPPPRAGEPQHRPVQESGRAGAVPIRQQHGDLPLIEDGVEVGVGFCVFPSKSTQASSTPRRPQQARRIASAI
jgi:hypothetical protein